MVAEIFELAGEFIRTQEVEDRYMQQLKPMTLRRNFSWTFFGMVVYTGCQWGMLVVLAKLGSPEMVGQFTLGLAVTAPVVMFTNLQLRAVQATDAKHEYLFGDYLALRLISTALALLLIAGITFAAEYRWETALVILAVGLAKAFESVSDVFYGLLQQHERMDRIAVSMIIKGSLSLFLMGIGFYLTRSVLWGVVGLIIAWGSVLVSYDVRSGALILSPHSLIPQADEISANPRTVALQPRWHLITLGKLAWLALPLGIGMMLVSLNYSIPRYLVEGYLGERELGIFAALAYLMEVGNRVVIALGVSVGPRLAKYYAEGNSIAFRALLLNLVGIGAVLGGAGVLVALVAGRKILTLLYESEYAEYADVFVWLMVAAGISYVSSFLSHGITAARYFRIQIPLFAFVTTTLVLACLWLLPSFGLQGAAMALTIAAVVQAGFSLGVILHVLHRLHKHTQIK